MEKLRDMNLPQPKKCISCKGPAAGLHDNGLRFKASGTSFLLSRL